jgi:putative flippase GtrA
MPRHNVAMGWIRTLFEHPLAGATVRYGIAGGTVAVVYIGMPLLLHGVFGVPLEAAVPIAYVAAVSLHFTLQRLFVWRHVGEFALSGREQGMRYLMIGAVQYPVTALAIAVLPGVLSVSESAVFVGVTIVTSIMLFLVLRSHVFHAVPESESVSSSTGSARRRPGTSPRHREAPDPRASA